MITNPTNNEQFDIHTSVGECSSPCIVACRYACMQTNIQEHMHENIIKKCKLGLSNDQINIISIIKDTRLPLSYKHIADILNTAFQRTASAGVVRGSVSRLKDNGFIESQYTSLGSRRGNIYIIKPLVCSDIPMFNMHGMETSVQFNMYPAMQTPMYPNTSSFKDRIDNNLSIFNPPVNPATNPNTTLTKQRLESLSENDIRFHFEYLAKNGFGTSQIQQIIIRLYQTNTGLENVMQGLTHAEWDLKHNQMKDKHGELIKSPTSWVFQILAKQGYYPRPKNYISPAEQIELDVKMEMEALKKAKKKFEDEQYKNWLNSLSKEEKSEIIAIHKKEKFKNIPVPEDAIMHSFYKEQF